MKAGIVALLIVLAGAAQAVELRLPSGARQMIARDTEQDRFLVPIGVFADDSLPTVAIEGQVARSSWRIDVGGLTPLQLIAPLRDQLVAAGYDIVLDCGAQECGGYDFRFAAEILPAPNMQVNIRSFNALTAVIGPKTAPTRAVNIIASASDGASFVQIIQAGSESTDTDVQPTADVPVIDGAVIDGSLSQTLVQQGYVVLSALDFDTGTSNLGAGPFAIIEQLAQALRDAPDMRLALVGHTDNVGGLDVNIGVSRGRANAVRRRLIDAYGIAASRLEAEGMGYLSPITTNQTELGREANRRVEAVVLAP